MTFNAATFQAITPNTPAEYADVARERNFQRQRMKIMAKSAEEEALSRRRNMAISMLSGVRDPDTYQKVKPIVERYDPSIRLPEDYDPGLTRALYSSALDPKDAVKFNMEAGQPQYKTVGGTLGRFDPQQGTFEPIYQAPNQMAMPKPPAGYQWAGDGQLSPIPGGPAEKLTPEQAAKTAQVDNARANIPRIRELMVDGVNPVDYYVKRGDVGEGRRLVRSAIEGYLRATSGAAVPESEVNRAVDLFEPTPFDTPETRQRKIDQLERFLSGTGENMKLGRRAQGAPAGQPKPQQPIKFLGFE